MKRYALIYEGLCPYSVLEQSRDKILDFYDKDFGYIKALPM